MYSSKLFLVSVAALVALFVHSPATVSAAAVEGRAPALCHVGKPNQILRYDAVLSDIKPTGPAGQCCAGDIVGSCAPCS
ncbi:hypothetical protein B0H14DRAFT_3447326 [Mycena olivaceomarginata]|nr:hypothetical protein B0H14DRAFT_3447326 [Mycena olivaceomarginata]